MTCTSTQPAGPTLLLWLTCVKVWPEVVFQVLADFQQHDTLQLRRFLGTTAQLLTVDVRDNFRIKGWQLDLGAALLHLR